MGALLRVKVPRPPDSGKVIAEHQGYAGVPIHVRIAEHNNIIADLHKQECEN